MGLAGEVAGGPAVSSAIRSGIGPGAPRKGSFGGRGPALVGWVSQRDDTRRTPIVVALPRHRASLRTRFGLQQVTLVGERGMIAQTRIDKDLQPAGLNWVTALRHSTI